MRRALIYWSVLLAILLVMGIQGASLTKRGYFKFGLYTGIVTIWQEAKLMFRARIGDPYAQYEVGGDCNSGTGTYSGQEPNRDKAVYWYKKAALQGESRASSNLSTFLWGKSRDEALGWLLLSAKQGDSHRQGNLAFFYKKGMHLMQCDVLACAWMLVCDQPCVGGSGTTRLTIVDIKEGMSRKEIEDAVALAEKFREKIRTQAWKKEALENPSQLFSQWGEEAAGSSIKVKAASDCAGLGALRVTP
jgi:TPR repeat protein